MEPNEGEDLISFLGRAEREVLYGDTFTDSAGTVPTQVVSNLLSGGGGVMTVGGQRVPISSWSINPMLSAGTVPTPDIQSVSARFEGTGWGGRVSDITIGGLPEQPDKFRINGHTYRRIEAGKPVLPPACATLAGLLAFVLAHPSDAGAVAALADRLALSEDREREVPEVVGALVDEMHRQNVNHKKEQEKRREGFEILREEHNQHIEELTAQVAALEADNRALRERVGRGAR